MCGAVTGLHCHEHLHHNDLDHDRQGEEGGVPGLHPLVVAPGQGEGQDGGLPFVSVRGVSDLCGPQAGEDFHIGADVAAARSAAVVLALLGQEGI